MKKAVCILVLMLLALPMTVAGEDGKAEKRAKIDAMAKKTMDELFEESADTKGLSDKAVAYAVFSNLKVAVGISGGGGSGVAVDKASGKRTYMKMGTGGVGLGLGGQKYQLVFFFEKEKNFQSFVETGWQADAGARAAAGTEGASAHTGFIDGIAIYHITETGLMASADVSGTKYWKNKKLNVE